MQHASAPRASISEYKIRASILLKHFRAENPYLSIRAAERFRLLPKFQNLSVADILAIKGQIRLKHALAVIAREAGFPDWNAVYGHNPAHHTGRGGPRVTTNRKARSPRKPDPLTIRRRLPTELQLMYWILEMQADPSLPRNAWLQRDGAQVYVRAGRRLLQGVWIQTLEIANWHFSSRHRGKDRLIALFDLAERLNPWDAVYIEAPSCECLEAYLRSDGWANNGQEQQRSFYRLRHDFARLAENPAHQESRNVLRATRPACECCS
jgi:hypothetical protein